MSQSEPTEGEISALAISILITSSLSGVSAMIALSYFALQPKLHNFEGFLIAMLLVGDFIQATSIGIPQMMYFNKEMPSDYGESASCIAQGILQDLGLLTQFTWSFNIAFCAYNQAFSIMNSRNMMLFLTTLGFSLPVTFSVLPWITDQVGLSYPEPVQFSTTLCYIQMGQGYLIGTILVILTYLTPLIIGLVLNTYMMIQVARKILEVSEGALSSRVYVHLLTYPFILLICQIWFIMLNFYNVFFKADLYSYQVWCYIMSNLIGFLDAIAYGYNFIGIQNKNTITETTKDDNRSRELTDIELAL